MPLRLTSAPNSSCGVTPRTSNSSSTVSNLSVPRRVGGGQAGVVFGFRTVLPRLVVLVQPVQDGVGDFFGHARQGHQQVAAAVSWLDTSSVSSRLVRPLARPLLRSVPPPPSRLSPGRRQRFHLFLEFVSAFKLTRADSSSRP